MKNTLTQHNTATVESTDCVLAKEGQQQEALLLKTGVNTLNSHPSYPLKYPNPRTLSEIYRMSSVLEG